MLSIRQWDSVGKASRIRIMSALLRKYAVDKSSLEFDIPRLSVEMKDEICLFIPRITSMLEQNLKKRKHSFQYHVKCLCMFLLTNVGQDLAESSPKIMKSLTLALDFDQSQQMNCIPRDSDLVAALVMIKKVCASSEYLRKVVLHFKAMSLVSTLLQRVHWSDALQTAGCNLLLDLATVDASAARALSCVFHKLFNSPQINTKHSAVKMWTSILYTKSAVTINLDGWETDALVQLTRLLCCAPLSFQYDTSELLALLFSSASRHSGLRAILPQLMKQCGAVLCLRYTLGGSSIVQPPLDWNMKFYAGYALEAPEILVSSVVSTALKYGCDSEDDLAMNEMTSMMRENKLHYLLMAHIFWYIRDRDALAKAVSVWTETGDTKIKNKSNLKLKHALKIKMWLMRVNAEKLQSPEIQRATAVMSSANQYIRKLNNEKKLTCEVDFSDCDDDEGCGDVGKAVTTEFTAQELCCLSAIAALQWWVQVDPVAAADIEAEFVRFSFQPLIETIEVLPQYFNDAVVVIDIAKSMQNVLKKLRIEARSPELPVLFGKTGARSVHLSKMLAPGQLVKDVKVALTDALILEGENHAALEASLDEFSASVDLSFSGHSPSRHSKDKSRLLVGSPAKMLQGEGKGNVSFLESTSMPVSKDGIKSVLSSVEGRSGLVSGFDDSESDSDSDSDEHENGATAAMVVAPSMTLRVADRPHRLSVQVKAPPLPKGVVVDEGRVTRWQEDEEKHQRGKEYHRRVTAASLAKETERLRRFTPRREKRSQSVSPERESATLPLPSPPPGLKSSRLYQRPRSTATAVVPQPRGLPPPELDAEQSILSVKSFIETVWGDSIDTLSKDKSPVKGSNRSPSKKASSSSNTSSLLECVPGVSSDAADNSLSTEKISTSVEPSNVPEINPPVDHLKENNSRINNPELNEDKYDKMTDAALSRGNSRSKSRPPSTQRKLVLPDSGKQKEVPREGLCKPQSFAHQMIKELTELKDRADDITEEERARLRYINNAIQSIIAQESSMVSDISERLEDIRVESEEDTRVMEAREQAQVQEQELEQLPAQFTRDPLTPFYYNVQQPQQATRPPQGDVNEEVDSQAELMVSYRKFAAYHRDKNEAVLSELASLDFEN